MHTVNLDKEFRFASQSSDNIELIVIMKLQCCRLHIDRWVVPTKKRPVSNLSAMLQRVVCLMMRGDP